MSRQDDSESDFQPVSAEDEDQELPDAQTEDLATIQSHYIDEIDSDDDLPQQPTRSTRGDSKNRSKHRISTSKIPRIVPALVKNPYAVEPSYFTRPNRFFGPPSTWRSWTAEERLVVQSLDKIRSQNLSIHLFNAFALKQRGTASRTVQKTRSKGKERATSSDGWESDEQDQSKSFIPRKIWTAWPLEPDVVPRDEMMPSFPPSAALEEAVIAATTKVARERWRLREWQPTEKELRRHSSVSEHKPIPTHEHAGLYDEVSEGELSMAEDPDAPVFKSQAFESSSDDEVEAQMDEKGIEADRRPTPSADEDKIRSLLLPSTRHILSKLDDLLLGLHKTRKAYAIRSSRRGTDSEATDTETSQHKSRSRGRSVSRKRKRSGSIGSEFSAASRTSKAVSNPKPTSKPLGLRDWSDVLGMASLTGWDQATIQRASERCASLFGEDMMFRTFHERDGISKEKSFFTEEFATGEDDTMEFEDSEGPGAPPKTLRTSKACDRCSRLKEKCEPAQGRIGRVACKQCLDAQQKCSGITSAEAEEMICPIPNCKSNLLRFKTRRHLERHLAMVHRGMNPPPSFPEKQQSNTRLPSLSDIICPVLTCSRNQDPFRMASQLYQHVRNVHPELYVNEVKKTQLARHGDRRGRWRSSSRAPSSSRLARSSSPVYQELD